MSHGPGGLAGTWLGEVTASFIGAAGAALAATTLLVIGLLLVTEISMREVAVVLSWAARHARHGIVAGRRGHLAGGAGGVPREGRRR